MFGLYVRFWLLKNKNIFGLCVGLGNGNVKNVKFFFFECVKLYKKL